MSEEKKNTSLCGKLMKWSMWGWVISALCLWVSIEMRWAWLGIPSLILSVVFPISALCFWVVGVASRRRSSSVPYESPKPDKPNVPPPVTKGKDTLADDPWRGRVEDSFKHVEQLILNLHKQHEHERSEDALRAHRMASAIAAHFKEASDKSLHYTVIGIIASLAGSFIISILVLKFGEGIVAFLFETRD